MAPSYIGHTLGEDHFKLEPPGRTLIHLLQGVPYAVRFVCSAAPKVLCEDLDAKCAEWAMNQPSCSNDDFMRASCRASCRTCERGPARGQLRVRLRDAASEALIHEFDWLSIEPVERAYELPYNHTQPSAMDVRLEFDLGSTRQELYLDKVELSRVLPHPPLAPQPPAAPLPNPFLPLHNGINLDVALPDAGVWFKTQYEPAQMQAIAEAGFESVRVFLSFNANLSQVDAQIDDALSAGLSIVVCLWGLNEWAEDPELGRSQIAERWHSLAARWVEYPNGLVFELLNEPEGIGFAPTHEANEAVMSLYEAALRAVRSQDANRPVLLGSPGYNDPEWLDPYVTDAYLTPSNSTAPDEPIPPSSGNCMSWCDSKTRGWTDLCTWRGCGACPECSISPPTPPALVLFSEDPNVGVAIHIYRPKGLRGTNWAMWTDPLGADEERWQRPIAREVKYVVRWRAKHAHSVPVITTEWGCWLFESRVTDSGDLDRWLRYHLDLFAANDIGSMWYTGIQHNQRGFGIFDTEMGWTKQVLDRLTGRRPASWPSFNQVINGEFFTTDGWQLSSDAVSAEIFRRWEMPPFSGRTTLKLTVPDLSGEHALLYQQTFGSHMARSQEPGEPT